MENELKTVWVVAYYNKGDKEPTVSVFNNDRAADEYRVHLKEQGCEHVSMDPCPVYSLFNTN